MHVKHLSPDQMAVEPGVGNILTGVLAGGLRTRDALAKTERVRREAGEAMETYLPKSRLAHRQIDAANPNTSYSDLNLAQRVLRRPGLLKHEPRAVLGGSGAEWSRRSKPALRFMDADCYLEDSRFRPHLRGKAVATSPTITQQWWAPGPGPRRRTGKPTERKMGVATRRGVHYADRGDDDDDEGDEEEQG